jgi:hypothetical protein
MRTWKELGAEFLELGRSISYIRLDIQWGSAGERWHFAGAPLVAVARERFRTLFAMAGEQLLQLNPADLPDELQSIADHEHRWVTALRLLSPELEDRITGEHVDLEGRSIGPLVAASLRQPAHVSANLCLRLESRARSRRSALETLLDRPDLLGAARHWKRAQAAVASDPPDLVSAAKEAVDALEAVAKHVTAMPAATLGECLNRLRASAEIHPALLKSLEGVWGFANASPGLRHGSPSTPSINEAELRYVMAAAEAGIVLLLP